MLYACIAAYFINYSNLVITQHDRDFFSRIKKEHKCAERYKKSPCLKRVEKRGFQNYRLVCG